MKEFSKGDLWDLKMCRERERNVYQCWCTC